MDIPALFMAPIKVAEIVTKRVHVSCTILLLSVMINHCPFPNVHVTKSYWPSQKLSQHHSEAI